IAAAAHHGIKLGRAYARRFAVVLDEFTERLTGNVHARKRHKASRLPCRNAAVETGKIAVAGIGKDNCGAFRKAVIVVTEDNTGCFARHEASATQFPPAERHTV